MQQLTTLNSNYKIKINKIKNFLHFQILNCKNQFKKEKQNG